MRKKSTTFYCFSPPAMLLTFAVEFIMAIYTIIRYRMTTVGRLAAAALGLLAIFQLSEFNVCGLNSTAALTWSRIGYVSITLLPPIAIHLVHVIAKKKSRTLVPMAYVMSVVFIIIFGLNKAAFASHICAGNYAIFQLIPRLGGTYFAYYYSWLIAGIGLCLYYGIEANKATRQALALQAIGYLSFLLPTGIVNAVNPQTINGIPSIMCGFAVIYAIILVVGIVPTVVVRPTLLSSLRNRK
jgi:hypothetical protein